MTPLHYAARYGKIDSEKATEATKSEKTWKAIAFLMKHSNDKNAKDKYGFTVLHHAVYRGNTLAVQRLIEGKEVRGRPPKYRNTVIHKYTNTYICTHTQKQNTAFKIQGEG